MFRQLVHCSNYLAGEPESACPPNGKPFQDVERVSILCSDVGFSVEGCRARSEMRLQTTGQAQGCEASPITCSMYQRYYD